MVPPPPFIGGSQTGNTGLGNGIVQPGVTGGQNNSAENQGGPGGAGGQSSTENQGGPGVSGNQSGSQSSSSHAQEAALPQVKARRCFDGCSNRKSIVWKESGHAVLSGQYYQGNDSSSGA